MLILFVIFRKFKFSLKIITIFSITILLFSSIFIYYSVKANKVQNIHVPIIMYHSVLKSKSGKYIVHPETLENDLKYIKDHGYTTITMTDLINNISENIDTIKRDIINNDSRILDELINSHLG